MAPRWIRLAVVGAIMLSVVGSAPAGATPSRALTVQVLVMTPTNAKARFTAAALTAGAKAAVRFWTAESGGAITFKLQPTKSRTSAALRHCSHLTDKTLASKLFGIRTTARNTIYLVGNAGSTCTTSLGRGELNGAWVTLSVPNAGVIAHEMGHIFGLLHAGSAACAPPAGQFGLSTPDATCRTEEYGDSDDIMGINFSPDLRSVALSGLTLAKLGYIEPRRADGSGKWTLGPTENGSRPIVVSTDFGDAYIEYSIGHKGTLFGAENDHSVQIRLQPKASKTNDSLQLWAYRDARTTGDVNGPYLHPGDRLRIPGSNLTLAVGAMDRTGADLALSTFTDPMPAKPSAPAQARLGSGVVTFAAVEGAVGYVFYVQTLSGPQIVGSLRGAAERWTLPDALSTSVSIGVAAASADCTLSAITWAKP